MAGGVVSVTVTFCVAVALLSSASVAVHVTTVVPTGKSVGASLVIVTGPIKSVPVGQLEAARAYGMGGFQSLRRITLPTMLPYAIPGLANLWLIATKDTALLAVVGFSELTLETRQAAGSTKHYLLFYCAAGVLYLLVTLISQQLIRVIEKHARRGLPQES